MELLMGCLCGWQNVLMILPWRVQRLHVPSREEVTQRLRFSLMLMLVIWSSWSQLLMIGFHACLWSEMLHIAVSPSLDPVITIFSRLSIEMQVTVDVWAGNETVRSPSTLEILIIPSQYPPLAMNYPLPIIKIGSSIIPAVLSLTIISFFFDCTLLFFLNTNFSFYASKVNGDLGLFS